MRKKIATIFFSLLLFVSVLIPFSNNVFAETMEHPSSGKSVDVSIDVTLNGKTAKDSFTGSTMDHADIKVLFYKPDSMDMAQNVSYAISYVDSDPKSNCIGTQDVCRVRIPGMFGSSSSITVVDNGKTIGTISSDYSGMISGIYVSKGAIGGQNLEDAASFTDGHVYTMKIIIGAIDGKPISQETADFSFKVSQGIVQPVYGSIQSSATPGLDQYMPVQNANILLNNDQGVTYWYSSGNTRIDGSIHKFSSMDEVNSYMMRTGIMGMKLKDGVYSSAHCADGVVQSAYNLWCQDGYYTVTLAADANNFDLQTPMKQILDKIHGKSTTTKSVTTNPTPSSNSPTASTDNKASGGGCLIATATYGSELAPQVQQLRELRDNQLLQTSSGTSFMTGFNQFYYSFSPTVADWERENPAFKELVKITLTPMLSSLSLLNNANMDSDSSVLTYGLSLIMLNVGMYFVAPVMVIHTIRKRL